MSEEKRSKDWDGRSSRPVGETREASKKFKERESKESKRGGYVQSSQPTSDKPPPPKK